MKVTKLTIPEVLLIENEIKGPEPRGWCVEAFNEARFTTMTGQVIDWEQDCRFFSAKGALRGPHFYPASLGQFKLVECITGVVFDVAVCVDPRNSHFGEYVGVLLEGGSARQVLVPPGFAHAVLAIEDSIVQYKTNVGDRVGVQRALAWNDAQVSVKWPITPTVFSKEVPRPLSELSYYD